MLVATEISPLRHLSIIRALGSRRGSFVRLLLSLVAFPSSSFITIVTVVIGRIQQALFVDISECRFGLLVFEGASILVALPVPAICSVPTMVKVTKVLTVLVSSLPLVPNPLASASSRIVPVVSASIFESSASYTLVITFIP